MYISKINLILTSTPYETPCTGDMLVLKPSCLVLIFPFTRISSFAKIKYIDFKHFHIRDVDQTYTASDLVSSDTCTCKLVKWFLPWIVDGCWHKTRRERKRGSKSHSCDHTQHRSPTSAQTRVSATTLVSAETTPSSPAATGTTTATTKVHRVFW